MRGFLVAGGDGGGRRRDGPPLAAPLQRRDAAPWRPERTALRHVLRPVVSGGGGLDREEGLRFYAGSPYSGNRRESR